MKHLAGESSGVSALYFLLELRAVGTADSIQGLLSAVEAIRWCFLHPSWLLGVVGSLVMLFPFFEGGFLTRGVFGQGFSIEAISISRSDTR